MRVDAISDHPIEDGPRWGDHVTSQQPNKVRVTVVELRQQVTDIVSMYDYRTSIPYIIGNVSSMGLNPSCPHSDKAISEISLTNVIESLTGNLVC